MLYSKRPAYTHVHAKRSAAVSVQWVAVASATCVPGSQQDPAAPATAALAGTVTDEDVLRQHHRFLRTAADDAQDNPADWGVRLAKRYYARLFKEYAIADLSRYKETKVGMRWRTKAEVESGKGQFVCGAKGCNETFGLGSYEVNFSYVEAGQHKQALVKLRLCATCAAKLNYKRKKEYSRVGQGATLQQQQQTLPDRGDSVWEQHEQHSKQKSRHERKDRDRDKHGVRGQDDAVDKLGSDSARHRSSDSKRKRQGDEQDGKNAHKQQQRREEDEGHLGSSHEAAAAVRAERKAPGGATGADSTVDRQQKSDVISEADIEHWLDDMFAAA
eukprot:GHUV01008203.1.p1 GENE.GHUV01008203.1~~GHUV01008203.1.p1  ORF type:complete len:330 (+),score=111.93 GHUV01008203.1:203-1192(+)